MKTKEEIDNLAENKFNEKYYPISKKGYIEGYTQCQEDMAKKKYTEEDIISIVNKSRSTGLTAEYLILQLNKDK